MATAAEAYVEELVFQYLSSLRTSEQMEDRYQVLSRKTKGATTKQLKELASRAATYLVSNVNSMSELAALDDDSLVREALLRALTDE